MLGPISEEDVKLIVKTLNKKGLRVSRNDIVMDIEEGRLVGAKFFEGNDIFKDPTAYPMLRMVASGNVFACKFLSANSGKCSIYEFRPQMCRDYYCQYVLTNFLLRTKQKQNTYLKIR
jgi:Fe-S-cluster containining protein